MRISAAASTPRFRGVSITHHAQGTRVDVTGLANDFDVVSINGSPFARSSALGQITRRLAGGEKLPEESLRRILAGILGDYQHLDESVQQERSVPLETSNQLQEAYCRMGLLQKVVQLVETGTLQSHFPSSKEDVLHTFTPPMPPVEPVQEPLLPAPAPTVQEPPPPLPQS